MGRTFEEGDDMADAIIWEFDGVGRDDYDAVNEKLGIDPPARPDDRMAGSSTPERRSPVAGPSSRYGSRRKRRSSSWPNGCARRWEPQA
jgi:hypothetical protein